MGICFPDAVNSAVFPSLLLSLMKTGLQSKRQLGAKGKAWGLTCDPSVLCKCSVCSRAVAARAHLKMQLNRAMLEWWMRERREQDPLLLFGALEAWHFLECCACLISEDVLHPHNLPYSLGCRCARMREGEKQVLWHCLWADVYTMWRKHNSGLWSKAALRQASHFPSVQLLAV